MHKLTILFLLLFLLIACTSRQKEENKIRVAETAPGDEIVITKTEAGSTDTLKKSLKAFIAKKIGPATIIIRYHSPAVRNRVIWGGLVPYDQVWVTGAHMATNIEFDKDLIIGGTLIAKGKYAIFTIPGKEKWIFVINKNWEQHLADEYNAAEDLVRVEVMPGALDYVQERLLYDINPVAGKNGEIELRWEKLKLTVPVHTAD